MSYRCTKKCWFLIQGDVFCFTKLEEALIEVNFVIEAVHEDLEDKKSLLESKTIITQQFFSTYNKYLLPILMLIFLLPIEYQLLFSRSVKILQAICDFMFEHNETGIR